MAAFKGQTLLFINNKFVPAASGKTFNVVNPSTGQVGREDTREL